MGRDFSADSVSWRLRGLHLAAWEVECFLLSVGRELALYVSTVYRTDHFCIYRLAFVHGALVDAWEVDLCERCRRYATSVVSGIFCDWNCRGVISSWRWNLEFSLQVGVGCDGARAERRRKTGRGCRIWI